MSACPSLEHLCALLRGELSQTHAGEIEDHLEHCVSCRSRLHSLSDWAFSSDLPLSRSRPHIGPRSRAFLDRLAQGRSPGSAAACEPGALSLSAASPSKELPPPELPGFVGIREVGRGGMGTVYRADQIRLDRPVALKTLSEGRMAGAGSRERFRREILALARLQHPNVVRIYGVQEWDGLDFLVMEWVEGGDLAQRLRDGLLPAREVAELALPLARALQAAHDQGIIHRDLKPSNILLSAEASDGFGRRARLIPKISDFGLAKMVEDEAGLTISGAVVGTPNYMAPEQTGLLSASLQGPTTDIYGLGTIIYEMLVGRPPFGGSTRDETIRQIVASDVVPPRRLRPLIPRDLETICLKCLERESGRRYATAQALVEELERFLDGRAIKARRANAWERGMRWCRRKPSEAGLLIALIVVVLMAFASVTWLWRRANAEAVRAVQAADSESRLRSRAQAEVAMRDLDQGIAAARAGDLDQGLLWMAESLRRIPAERPDLARFARANLSGWSDGTIPLRAILEHQGIIDRALYCPGGRTILTGSKDGTARFWDATTGRPLSDPLAHGDQVLRIAISPDGRITATSGADKKIVLWDSTSHRRIGHPIIQRDLLDSVEFSPDGRLLTGRSLDGYAQLWDVATGLPVCQPLGDGKINRVRFSPDGRSLLTAGTDGAARFWDTENGRPAGPELSHGGDVLDAIFGPGRRRIATSGADGGARIWDLADGRAIGRAFPHGEALDTVVFSPDERILLTASALGACRLWDVDTGAAVGAPIRHPLGLNSAAFSPDGRMLLTGGVDQTARLWDVASCQPISSPLRHRGDVNHVLFSPDGGSLLTTGMDGAAKIWDLDAVDPIRPGNLPQDPASSPPPVDRHRASRPGFTWTSVSPDRSRILLQQHHQGLVRMFATADGQSVGPPLKHRWSYIGWVAFSPLGDRFATSCLDRDDSGSGRTTSSTCQIFTTATGLPVGPILPHMNWPAKLAFRADGKVLATGDYDATVHLWDVETGRPLGPPLKTDSIVSCLAFSPDGRILAAGTFEMDHQVVLWDLETRRRRGVPIRFKAPVLGLAFSSDGSRLAAGSADTTVRLIDVATGAAMGETLRHDEFVAGLAFSPGGEALLTTTRREPKKSAVRLWDAATGRPVSGALVQSSCNYAEPRFSPDGTLFATGGVDGSIAIWDIATARQVGPTHRLTQEIMCLSFSPDGEELMAADAVGRICTWRVPRPSPEPVERLIRRVQVRTGLEFDQVQQVGVLDPTAWQRLREELVASEDSSDPAHDRGWHEDRAREAESVGDGFAARWHLDRLIAARPDDGLLHARRAAARLQGGGDASVEAELERAIALGPRDRVVDWIANRAVDLRAAGRAEASVRLLDRAVSARPDDWRLHWLRAEALAPIGRHTERQAELSRAIELGAEIPSLLGIADEWSRAGRSSEAARLYDRAINRGVVPYEAWMQAALTHLADDDKEGYRRTCAAMRSRLPANYSPIQVELHLARVCTLAPGGLGDDGRAPEWAGGRFAKDSDAESRENRVLMLRRRGAVSYRLGRYPEAINSIEQAIADSDGRVDLEDLAFLSMALCQAGDRRKALQMLTRLREDQSIRTGMSHWEAESRSQLQREAEQLIHGESFPDDVFAP